jgi:hypothetical protein
MGDRRCGQTLSWQKPASYGLDKRRTDKRSSKFDTSDLCDQADLDLTLSEKVLRDYRRKGLRKVRSHASLYGFREVERPS